jgi:1,4-alpha-glucan branching enzyme
MIRTKPLKADGKVEVAFVIPAAPEVPLCVVGDFNDWDPHVTPMKPGKEGLQAKVTVDTGRRYAFRYLSGAGSWFNDDAADTYEPGPYGSDNSVIDLTDQPTPQPKPPRTRRAKA